MLRPYTYITIDGNQLNGLASSIVVESRRNLFTDKAEIVMSNNIPGLDESISDKFAPGNTVTIEIGYYPNKHTVFTGYISEIIPDRTATIICEDEAYIYKRQTIDKALLLRNTTTTALFDQIFSGSKLVFDAKIGDWKIQKDASVIDVLNKLRNDFSIFSYFRNGKLIVGGGLNDEEGTENNIIADFQGNVPEGESSIDLKESTAQSAIVKAVSQNRDGTKVIVYGTYSAGNNIVLSAVKPAGRITSTINLGKNDSIARSTLEELVTRKLRAEIFTGVNGSVTIYGEPQVKHGDIIELKDVTRPEIDGQYKCVGVVTSFSVDGGFRQSLELGIQIDG